MVQMNIPGMITGLKIKLAGLAAEGTAIGKAKRKLKRIIDFECQTGTKRGSGHFKHKKDQPRPLPREYPVPKENAQEIVDEAFLKYWNLYEHHVKKLRVQARISHLAYGFLRGVPYSAMEQSTHDSAGFFEDFTKDMAVREKKTFDHVKREAKKFSEFNDNDFAQKWAEWYDEAWAHLTKQGKEKKPSKIVVTV